MAPLKKILTAAVTDLSVLDLGREISIFCINHTHTYIEVMNDYEFPLELLHFVRKMFIPDESKLVSRSSDVRLIRFV